MILKVDVFISVIDNLSKQNDQYPSFRKKNQKVIVDAFLHYIALNPVPYWNAYYA